MCLSRETLQGLRITGWSIVGIKSISVQSSCSQNWDLSYWGYLLSEVFSQDSLNDNTLHVRDTVVEVMTIQQRIKCCSVLTRCYNSQYIIYKDLKTMNVEADEKHIDLPKICTPLPVAQERSSNTSNGLLSFIRSKKYVNNKNDILVSNLLHVSLCGYKDFSLFLSDTCFQYHGPTMGKWLWTFIHNSVIAWSRQTLYCSNLFDCSSNVLPVLLYSIYTDYCSQNAFLELIINVYFDPYMFYVDVQVSSHD